LDGGTDGDDFVRVDAFVGVFAKKVFDYLLDPRHTGHTSDQDDFIDVFGGEFGVFEGGLDRIHGFLDEVVNQGLEFGTVKFQIKVKGITVFGLGNVGLVDFGFLSRREFDFGFFGGVTNALESLLVRFKVDGILFFEFFDYPVDDDDVKIVAAEVGIAVGGFDFENAITQFENGDVKSTATEVVDGDFFKARAAAVGSLMMRSTLRPAISPACLVAWRWESSK
jgi:hypothetical protein